MSSQEDREARRKRIARQVQGALEQTSLQTKRHTKRPDDDYSDLGPNAYELTHNPWTDGYAGQEALKDEDDYIETELDFNDGEIS